MCSYLTKTILMDANKKIIDSEIALLDKILNTEINDYSGIYWGLMYSVTYFNNDIVLYYTKNIDEMRIKIVTLLTIFFKDCLSFYMPNIILFKCTNINPKLVNLQYLKSHTNNSELYYIIQNSKFNMALNRTVYFLHGLFTSIIIVMGKYTFMFDKDVDRDKLVHFYKSKTGKRTVSWFKSNSKMRSELVYYKYAEICAELTILKDTLLNTV